MPRHTRRLPTAGLRLFVMLLLVVSMTGCTKILGDLAAIPVKAVGTVAAETARLPFKVAETAARSVVDATLGNVERALFR